MMLAHLELTSEASEIEAAVLAALDGLQQLTTVEQIARERGIILADTKLEFGRGRDGQIVLGDEVLTPDSSRFWPAARYGWRRSARSRGQLSDRRECRSASSAAPGSRGANLPGS